MAQTPAFLARFAPAALLPEILPSEPLPILKAWFDEARAARRQPNPDAMTLATVDVQGRPSARIVLCRSIDVERGFVVFFTNRQSMKGEALAATGRAAAVFHFDFEDRQARIEGPVTHATEQESDQYFNSRRWESRIAAWASRQSQPLASRQALLQQVREAVLRIGLDEEELLAKDGAVPIPRPPHWGGYRIWAERVELWLGAPGRLHDRATWARSLELSGGEASCGPWTSTRLQP